jgi:protein phosphatase
MAASFAWDQCLEHAAVSDIGMRRVKNQDAHLEVLADAPETWQTRDHMFVVADGMGAHAAGELASKQAVEGVAHLYRKHQELSPPEALLKAIRDTNAEIHRRGRANAEFYNMGTTCSTLLLLPQGALVAHVGDSRVYRWRDQQLQQLTFDHSLVWEMRAAGQLSRDSEASPLIPKNVITRSLGPQQTVQVDLEGPFRINVGDIFVVCSDGLMAKVDDQELGAVVGNLPTREAAQLLVDLANLRGGPDNITVIVIRVVGAALATQQGSVAPLVVGAASEVQRSVHPLLWVSMGVCFLVAVSMLIVARPVAALVALLLGIVAIAWGILQRFGPESGVTLAGRRRLGKGPYSKTPCGLDALFFSRLDTVVDDVRQHLAAESWSDDDHDRESWLRQARQLAAQNELVPALHAYAQAAHAFLATLRACEESKASDSSIELF